MLGFVVNNPVSRFMGNRVSDVLGWFEKKNEEHETVEHLRTGKRSRIAAASIVLKKLAEDTLVSKENFEAGKTIIEKVCGIANLTYDEKECAIIDGGLTLDMAAIQPIITIYKADALTKEDLLKLVPELAEIKIVVAKSKDKEKKEENIKTSDSESKEKIKQEPETDKKEEKPVEEKVETDSVAKTETEESKQKTSSEEPKPEVINPNDPADISLKTIVEIQEESKTTDEKIQTAIAEGVDKGDLKVTSTPAEKKSEEVKSNPVVETPVKNSTSAEVKKEKVKVDQKPTQTTETTKSFMITFADKVRENMSKFENEIFDKVLKKFEKANVDGKLKSDIKITSILVKRCDKENKMVTFLLVNDSKEYPLLEVFYFTGNNKMSLESYATANELVDALKNRREKSKTDKSLEPKCYNIKYSMIPGYTDVKKSL